MINFAADNISIYCRRSGLTRLVFATLLIAAISSLPPTVSAQTNFRDEMARLIDKQADFATAYKYATETAVFKVDIEYDLWVGTAAVGVARLPEAIERLERFIASHPGNIQLPRARLELGRAYLLSGDERRARQQFKIVTEAHPPERVERNIQALLAAAKGTGGSRLSFKSSVSGGSGYDTNANGGVSKNTVSLPALGVVTIDRAGVKTPSGFTSLDGYIITSYRIDRNLSWIGTGKLESKFYSGHSNLNLMDLNLATGLAWRTSGGSQIRALVGTNYMNIGSEHYRDHDTLSADANVATGVSGNIILAASAGQIRYQGGNSSRDASTSSAVLGYQHKWNSLWSPVVFGMLAQGQENNVRNFPHLGRETMTARVGVSVKPSERWTVLASTTQQNSSYKNVDPLFLMTRRDTTDSLDLTLDYALDTKTSVVTAISSMKNRSNIALYSLDRNIASVKLRRNF